MSSIAHNFDIGLEIHETGFNILSARLFAAHPEWFSKRADFVINRRTGRTLTLAVEVTCPVRFFLPPVSDPPPDQVINANELLAEADVEFNLVDSIEGRVIWFKSTLQAIASIKYQNSQLLLDLRHFDIKALDVRDALSIGRNIRFKEIPCGENGSPLPETGAVDMLSVQNPRPPDARDFYTILDYLRTAFLDEGLKLPLVEYRVPELHLIPSVGYSIYLRSIAINSDKLGIYFRDTAGASEPSPMPAPPPEINPPHLSIGVTERIIKNVLRRSLPITIPLQTGAEKTFFRIEPGSTLTIKSNSEVNLIAPDKIEAKVYFNARLNFGVHVTIFGRRINITFPLPIGDPSYIYGDWKAFVKKEGEKWVLYLRPSPAFFDWAHVFILTDYRELIRAAVRRFLSQSVTPVLKKIPIIGWIIAKGVEVIVGELMGVFAVILDHNVSVILSLVSTVMFRAMKIWLNDRLEITIHEINQSLPLSGIQLNIEKIADPQIDSNQGGELVLDCWLEDPQTPPTPMPILEPLPDEGEEYEPPANITPPVITYPDNEFSPALMLDPITWQDNQTLTYDLSLRSAGTTTELIEILQIRRSVGMPEAWNLNLSVKTHQGQTLANSLLDFDASNLNIVNEEYTSIIQVSDEQNFAARSILVFDHAARMVQVDYQIERVPTKSAERLAAPYIRGSMSSDLRAITEFRVPEGATIAPSEAWIFMLMSRAIDEPGIWKLGRVDIDIEARDRGDTNWTRFLPLTIEVVGRERFEIGETPFQAIRVVARDEEITATVWVEDSEARRILKCDQRALDYHCSLQLRV